MKGTKRKLKSKDLDNIAGGYILCFYGKGRNVCFMTESVAEDVFLSELIKVYEPYEKSVYETVRLFDQYGFKRKVISLSDQEEVDKLLSHTIEAGHKAYFKGLTQKLI